MSTRKGRISVSLDISPTSLDWLTKADGDRTAPSPRQRNLLVLPHDRTSRGPVVPVDIPGLVPGPRPATTGHGPTRRVTLVLELDVGAVIWVNKSQAHTRQRFAIAHELGHHLLGHADIFHLDLGGAMTPIPQGATLPTPGAPSGPPASSQRA